jgi:hypothetical protein
MNGLCEIRAWTRGVQAMFVLGGALALALLDAPAARAGEQHPDFSGIYMPGPGRTQTPNPLPFTAKAKAMHEAYVGSFTDDDDPGYYCIAPGMPRAIWGAPFGIEVFHRPQDVTIFWEGYNQYRKIWIDGYPRPEPQVPTQMGYSVGHWEGEVLVVETTYLKEYPYMNRTPTSDAATIHERIWKETREVNGEQRTFLVNELVLTDPKLYTEPVKVRAQLVATPDTAILEYSCSDLLWEKHLQERGLTLPDFSTL